MFINCLDSKFEYVVYIWCNVCYVFCGVVQCYIFWQIIGNNFKMKMSFFWILYILEVIIIDDYLYKCYMKDKYIYYFC